MTTQTEYYISYREVDKLLYKYKALKALLHSYQVELERIYYGMPTEGLKEEDVLYALYFARELTDMPHSAPNPGDKMTNVIITKDRIMGIEYPQELIEAKYIVGEVVSKIAGALTSLTPEELQVIELYNFKKKDWKDVEDVMSKGRWQLGQVRKEAIEKMLPILRITPEQYEFCIGRVR